MFQAFTVRLLLTVCTKEAATPRTVLRVHLLPERTTSGAPRLHAQRSCLSQGTMAKLKINPFLVPCTSLHCVRRQLSRTPLSRQTHKRHTHGESHDEHGSADSGFYSILIRQYFVNMKCDENQIVIFKKRWSGHL